MSRNARQMPVLAYSLSGLAALKDSILYIPVWIVVFIVFSVVYTVYFNLVANYHAGQILINIKHYAQFDFANLSDANSLDYILQLKDIAELGLPIALAFFTVIPIAVARSRLVKEGDATAHIGFGQSELIVALNTLISYLPVFLFLLGLNIVFHVMAGFLSPHLPTTAAAAVANDGVTITSPPQAQHASSNWIHPAFGWISVAIAVPLCFFTYVRTSLSLPYTVEENRLGVLYSWRATSGFFWQIVQIEALAVVWAIAACGLAYAGFVAIYEFLFEKVYLIHYSMSFDGEMNAPWFFNLLAVSVIFILFLIFTFGPIVQIYRFVRPIDEDAEPNDVGGEDPDSVTA
jgi:hypothetical protein